MKKSFSLLLLIVMLCTAFVSPVLANRVDTKIGDPIEHLIEKVVVSDGFEADQLIFDLMDSFLSNPNAVMNTLEGYDKATQQCIIEVLAYHSVAYEDTSSLEQAIEEITWSGLKDQLNDFLNSVKYQNQDKRRSVQNTEIDMPEYDPTIIKGFVDTYQELSFAFDEEFFALMTNVYATDTNVFADAISELDSDEIETVALGMAITTQHHEELTLETDLYDVDELTAKETYNLELMESALEDAQDMMDTSAIERAAREIFSLDVQSDLVDSHEDFATKGDINSRIPAPIIGGLSWSNLNVGATATLSVPINDSGNAGTDRSYTIKVYCQRNGTWWLKHSGFGVRLFPSATSITAGIPCAFSDAGSFMTRVEVYRGSTLVASRTGASPDVTRGNWQINVDLPADRYKEGAIGIYNAGGARVQPIIRCLGRSASNASMGTYLGNTPIGDNTATLGNHGSDNEVYGPYKVVKLVAKSGHPYPNRTGIWIHGGRNQTSLTVTNGCIRVFNSDQKIIQDTLTSLMSSTNGHNATGRVIVQSIG